MQKQNGSSEPMDCPAVGEIVDLVSRHWSVLFPVRPIRDSYLN
jgi:hypothetical protein